MTGNPRMEPIEELLHASSDDEATLAFEVADRIFGFHAQQAVEKLLKVLITAHGQRFPFTHNLGLLLSSVQALAEEVPSTPYILTDLTSFAVGFRYMEPDELTPEKRIQVRESIRILREHVHTRLIALYP